VTNSYCFAASRGSRDLFPVGWCTTNQIRLVGQQLLVKEEEVEAAASSLAGQQQQQPVVGGDLTGRSSEDQQQQRTESFESWRMEVPGPRVGLTGIKGHISLQYSSRRYDERMLK